MFIRAYFFNIVRKSYVFVPLIMIQSRCTLYSRDSSRYLDSSGVLSKMDELLLTCRDEPFAQELIPGLVKFFGNIAHLRPRQVLVQHPAFLRTLFDMADLPDRTQRAIAFETIGYIGESLEGKASLAELGNRFTDCLDKLEALIRDGPTETRVSGMNTLASLVKLDKEHQTEELLSLTECWYRQVLSGRGGQPMGFLAGMVKLPFPDLRLAAYQVLNNIAQQVSGTVFHFYWAMQLLVVRLHHNFCL
jgi:26S proteasome non-ATPase regulatory subunit 5